MDRGEKTPKHYWMRILALNALIVASHLLIGCDRILLGESTKYSKGYSERAFRQVKRGMTVSEVLSLVGTPLNQDTQQWSEVWSYWPSESPPITSQSQNGSKIYNVFGKVSHLQFTQPGIVAAISGDYLDSNLVGLTREQVLARLGEPKERVLKAFEIIYHYSSPDAAGSGTYKRREVHFDTAGKVSSIVAEVYYD
jgi:outer membrane protein assembly factor BamE (lipoprotein component of BamABCDE complex)